MELRESSRAIGFEVAAGDPARRTAARVVRAGMAVTILVTDESTAPEWETLRRPKLRFRSCLRSRLRS
jgi:hypothetical protein